MEFLAKDMVAEYAITVDLSRSDPTAAACGLELCNDTSVGGRGLRIRDEVLASLAAFLVSPPSHVNLDVYITLPCERDMWCTDVSWVELARLVSDLKSLKEVDRSTNAAKLSMVLGSSTKAVSFKIGRLDGIDLLCSSSSVVRPRNLYAEFVESIFDANGRSALSLLMQWLVRQDTLRSLQLDKSDSNSGNQSNAREAHGFWESKGSIVCSALPHMTSLTRWKGVFEPSVWFVYALLSRQQRGLDISLELKFPRQSSSRLREARLTPNWLLGFIPHIVRLRTDPVVFPIGTTASVREGTQLKTSPFLEGSNIHTDQAWQLDVIARYGSRLLVVYPGVGLRWVDADTVDVVSESEFLFDETNPSVGLHTLTCVNSHSSDVVAFLVWGCSHLQCLRFTHHKTTIEAPVLEGMLRSCPRLTQLVFRHAKLTSFVPLVDAYARGECKISSFTYDDNRDYETDGLPEMLAALCDPRHAMAKTLEWLVLETSARFFPDGYEEHVHALAGNRRLRYLCVGRLPDKAQREFATSALQDQPLQQGETSRRALYGFLLSTQNEERGLQYLPPHCQQLIAVFAATRPRRQVEFAT